jgi:hypothetical protein
LTIHRKHNKLNFTIYRTPTSTDTLIHNSSCHPNEHKLASINYLINRLHTSIIKTRKRHRIRCHKNNSPKQPIQTYTHSHKTQKKTSKTRTLRKTKNITTNNGLFFHTQGVKQKPSQNYSKKQI